jgi:multicomponent Na+:H+ antiporter subunit G
MNEIISQLSLVMGALFMLLAAVGLLRMPDTYMRLQAASKGVTMGVGWMMLAVALQFAPPGGILRALAIFTFVYFTAPISAHLLGHVCYATGVPLWRHTHRDELCPVSPLGDHASSDERSGGQPITKTKGNLSQK